MRDKFRPLRLAAYLLGMLILAMGGAVSMRSNLGSSPVTSVPFMINLTTGLEIGLATTAWQAAMVIAQAALLGRSFRPWMCLQLVVGFLFGYFNTFTVWIVSHFPAPEGLAWRLFCTCLGVMFCAVGVWLYTASDVLDMPTDGIVRVIAQKSGRPFYVIKRIYDISSVALSGAVCLIVLHSLKSVGVGTVVISVMTGTMIGVFERHFGAGLRKVLKIEKAKAK